MNETQVILTIGNLNVTDFSLCVALGALLTLTLTVYLGSKRIGISHALSLCLVALPCALLGARLVYCITMLDQVLDPYAFGGLGFIPQLWKGGYTLYGALLGGAFGVWLYAHCTKAKVMPLLDVAVPGAALMLMVERAAEYFTTQGLGDYVMDEGLCFFPIAVQSVYGDWQLPVFAYEAAVALVLLMVSLFLLRNKPDGTVFKVFVVLIGLSQILLESLREDDFIRFGFVRFTQLAAIITVAAVFLPQLFLAIKAHGWVKWHIAQLVIFLLGIGICIGIEFALDKSPIDNRLLYAVMTATLVGMGFAVLHKGKSATQPARERRILSK